MTADRESYGMYMPKVCANVNVNKRRRIRFYSGYSVMKPHQEKVSHIVINTKYPGTVLENNYEHNAFLPEKEKRLVK